MGLLNIAFTNPLAFVILAAVLLYSVIFHEVAHGAVAYLMGDRTAKMAGRLSLNPMLHIDPIGLLMLFVVGFGWAKPVPVNYSSIKNFRLGLVLVSLAGCFTNIAIATVALLILSLPNFDHNTMFGVVIAVIAQVNIILGAFNLIPIPPLDGSKILMGFLPREGQMALLKVEPYGFIILIILIFTGLLTPVLAVVRGLILTVVHAVLNLIL